MVPKKETKRVAIQGGFGAFHEIAAMHYFENEKIEVIPANTFKDLFKSLKMNHADFGIMAIENSTAGSIMPNYGLLQESNMTIIGEIYLRIKQNLLALPGQTVKDLVEVYSHPMAIMQCQDFFNNHPFIRLLESIDTALSAKEIHDKQLKGIGAIASKLAADMYKLEVLEEGIETNNMNYTRFLILTDKHGHQKTEINKSSLTFSLAHRIGSLSKILSILSYYDMNLTKIQSMPILNRDWEYQFYIDVMFEDYRWYKQALEAIRPFTSSMEIMGEYTKGKTAVE